MPDDIMDTVFNTYAELAHILDALARCTGVLLALARDGQTPPESLQNDVEELLLAANRGVSTIRKLIAEYREL